MFPLISVLGNSSVQFGTRVEFLSHLSPGALEGGINLQNCFLCRLVAPFCWRLLGVRRPVSGVMGAYHFLPFGLGPSPGWDDACVKTILQVGRSRFSRLRVADFADDIRLVTKSGGRDALAADMTGAMSLFGDLG